MSFRRNRPFRRLKRRGRAGLFPGATATDEDLGLDLRIRVKDLPLPALDQELVIRGRLVAGSGAVELSIDGIQISQGDNEVNKLRIDDGGDVVAELYADRDTAVDTLLVSRGKDSDTHESTLQLAARTDDGAAHAGAAAVTLDLDTANDSISLGAGTTYTAGEYVHNEAGQDKDFRIESDAEAHIFFVDAGNDRIGIKTASPTGDCSMDFGSAEAVRLPRLTTTQRDNLTPASGMIIFNTTLNAVQAYTGSGWANL